MRTWMKTAAAGLVATGLLWSGGGEVLAQNSKTVSVPSNSKAVVYIDLGAAKRTPVGEAIVKLAKQEASNAISEMMEGSEGDPLVHKQEMLGLDPFEDLKSITISVSDYEAPEESVLAVIELGQTAGNLEGFVVTAPGYESSAFGDYTIHSVSPDEETRVYGSVHSDASGIKRIVAATSRGSVESVLGGLDGGAAAGFETVSLAGGEGAVISVAINELPLEELGEGPQSNIAKMLKAISVVIGNSNDAYTIDVGLVTESEQRSQQLMQLIQGSLAGLAFAAEMEDVGNDEEIQMALKMAQGIEVSLDGASISLRMSAPEEMIHQILREEGDLDIE